MTRDDIIKLAREAGVSESELFPGEQAIERFAALVAAAERESCARVCDLAAQANSYQGIHQTISDCAAAIRARGQA